tara:strand:- start:445 stop:918 length:474 start_codon:yes stop_codon:yes gene_type:complete
MNKENIYVVIDSEEKRLKAIEILSNTQEEIWEHSQIFFNNATGCLICRRDNLWYLLATRSTKEEINLNELEEILAPKQEIKLDALKVIAESYGFELVEKKREIKVGEFGIFWNEIDEVSYGFLVRFSERCYRHNAGYDCLNFRHLTDEEKKAITENW